jgi:biotin carboxyl carrier protein
MAEEIVKAPMRAKVMRFHVHKGSAVNAKDRICDIEALKMEIPVMAPAAGTLKEVFASAGQDVEAGDPLFSVES